MRAFIFAVGTALTFAASAAGAAAPADYLEKIRCLAAFEVAAGTLQPPPEGNTSNDPPEIVALRQRLDDVGERLGREVDEQTGLSESDREDGDRAYEEEGERLFSLLESARDETAAERAFQTLRGRVEACFSTYDR